jgi:hypothetical protein
LSCRFIKGAMNRLIKGMDDWIPKVRKTYGDALLGDRRFLNATSLLGNFDRAADLWAKRQSNDDVKALTETANELAAAASILSTLEKHQSLTYERQLTRTRKSIDFLVEGQAGPVLWIDVKTVAPEWVRSDREWERFEAIRAQLPESMQLTVMKEYGAAGIGSQMLKSRWSLYQRAAEIEAKADELSDHERAPVTLLFCGNGLAWDVDTLEDFADFYRSGRFHPDDWAANMLKRYMVERKIEFKRTLAGFHYLEMKPFEVEPDEYIMYVRGPHLVP